MHRPQVRNHGPLGQVLQILVFRVHFLEDRLYGELRTGAAAELF